MIAALAHARNSVIADAFLDEARMIPTAAASLGELRAFLVGLRCDSKESWSARPEDQRQVVEHDR